MPKSSVPSEETPERYTDAAASGSEEIWFPVSNMTAPRGNSNFGLFSPQEPDMSALDADLSNAEPRSIGQQPCPFLSGTALVDSQDFFDCHCDHAPFTEQAWDSSSAGDSFMHIFTPAEPANFPEPDTPESQQSPSSPTVNRGEERFERVSKAPSPSEVTDAAAATIKSEDDHSNETNVANATEDYMSYLADIKEEPLAENSPPSDPGASAGAASGSPVDRAAGAATQPYAQLIYQALMEAPDHTLALQDIYQWFRNNTSKNSGQTNGWQNSIRHNLSMNKGFEKVQPDGDARRSSSWRLMDWAAKNGIQSTTRYRRGTAPRRPAYTSDPSSSHQYTPYRSSDFGLGGATHSHHMATAGPSRVTKKRSKRCRYDYSHSQSQSQSSAAMSTSFTQSHSFMGTTSTTLSSSCSSSSSTNNNNAGLYSYQQQFPSTVTLPLHIKSEPLSEDPSAFPMAPADPGTTSSSGQGMASYPFFTPAAPGPGSLGGYGGYGQTMSSTFSHSTGASFGEAFASSQGYSMYSVPLHTGYDYTDRQNVYPAPDAENAPGGDATNMNNGIFDWDDPQGLGPL